MVDFNKKLKVDRINLFCDVVTKMAGVWQIFSPGNQFTVNISRGELKKMAEAITNNK